jgi:hypothetical protein
MSDVETIAGYIFFNIISHFAAETNHMQPAAR